VFFIKVAAGIIFYKPSEFMAKHRKERTGIHLWIKIRLAIHSEIPFIIYDIGLCLFFLAIPRPLKQNPFLKKIIHSANIQGFRKNTPTLHLLTFDKKPLISYICRYVRSHDIKDTL